MTLKQTETTFVWPQTNIQLFSRRYLFLRKDMSLMNYYFEKYILQYKLEDKRNF